VEAEVIVHSEQVERHIPLVVQELSLHIEAEQEQHIQMVVIPADRAAALPVAVAAVEHRADRLIIVDKEMSVVEDQLQHLRVPGINLLPVEAGVLEVLEVQEFRQRPDRVVLDWHLVSQELQLIMLAEAEAAGELLPEFLQVVADLELVVPETQTMPLDLQVLQIPDQAVAVPDQAGIMEAVMVVPVL
jgi:hypothetical protein